MNAILALTNLIQILLNVQLKLLNSPRVFYRYKSNFM